MKVESLLEMVLPEERRYLGLILVVAGLAHVGAFFVFKTPVLPWLRQPKAPQQVVWWGSGEEGRLGLDGGAQQVLALRDPRVAVLPPEPTVRAFALRLPVLRGLEEVSPGGERKEGWLVSDLPPYAERVHVVGVPWEPLPMPVEVESPPALRGSIWRLEGALAERKMVRRPQVGRPEVDAPLGVTVVRVEVGPEGLVTGAYVGESSGSFEVDRAGLAAARAMSFAPLPGRETMRGTVTFFWDYAEKGTFLETGGGR